MEWFYWDLIDCLRKTFCGLIKFKLNNKWQVISGGLGFEQLFFFKPQTSVFCQLINIPDRPIIRVLP